MSMNFDGGHKRLFYALLAVADIAYHGGRLPVQVRAIAQRQKLGERYLEEILAQLTKAAILRSTRGPKGGYWLARERRRITLADIADGIEKNSSKTKQPKTQTRQPFSLEQRVIAPLWQQLEEQLLDFMKDITIDDLCLRAHQQGIPPKSLESLDWTI